MSDNRNATALDRTLISTTEEYELRDWAKSLHVSPDEVKRAVAKVGHSAEKVREYLKTGKVTA